LREACMFDVEEVQKVEVRKILAKKSSFVRGVGRRSWNARPLEDGHGEIHVKLTDDWLLMSADVPELIAHLAKVADSAWACLRANQDFDGGAKIILLPDTNRLGVAVEVLWSDDEPDLDIHVALAYDGISQAGRWRPGAGARERDGDAEISPDLSN